MQYMVSEPVHEAAQALHTSHRCYVPMQSLHRGIYRGFGKPRELPEAYGLRDLWYVRSLVSCITCTSCHGGGVGGSVTVHLSWHSGHGGYPSKG